jgi:hypothetical protein
MKELQLATCQTDQNLGETGVGLGVGEGLGVGCMVLGFALVPELGNAPEPVVLITWAATLSIWAASAGASAAAAWAIAAAWAGAADMAVFAISKAREGAAAMAAVVMAAAC